jgi:hypothetical protein
MGDVIEPPAKGLRGDEGEERAPELRAAENPHSLLGGQLKRAREPRAQGTID